MLFWLIFVVIILLGYYYYNKKFKYWSRKGVRQFVDFNFFKSKPIPDQIQANYNRFPDARYFGSYNFSVPVLFVHDVELIKQITVKDFDHFVDHSIVFPEEDVGFLSKNLIGLSGQKWRKMRSTLSPSFTSSKMRHMFGLISQSAQQFTNYFLKQNESVVTVEMKDILSRYTNDVIANTAFGIEIDSLTDRENQFYSMGKKVSQKTGLLAYVKILLFVLFPRLMKLFGVKIFPKDMETFFTNIIKENIESREKNGIVRPDMINLLLEARKSGLKTEDGEEIEMSDDDIVAQAVIFFFAGFETVSSSMCFIAYELGVNQDVQERLRQEVDEVFESCKGELTYEALLNMKYLDMVVSETLRKWPVAMAIDRRCTKDFKVEPVHPGESQLVIEKDMQIWIPMYAIQRDPKYYPEPDKFDPERFSEDNKATLNPYTFLSFGIGPRSCIGSRFALLETKALFCHLLAHFEIVPVEKSTIPIKMAKYAVALTPEDGFWFGLKRRQ